MEFCAPHERRLRHEVARQGFDGTDKRHGHASRFDPFQAARSAIWLQAFSHWGLRSLKLDARGLQHCPLCVANEILGSGTGAVWIRECCAALVEYARQNVAKDPTPKLEFLAELVG